MDDIVRQIIGHLQTLVSEYNPVQRGLPVKGRISMANTMQALGAGRDRRGLVASVEAADAMVKAASVAVSR